MQDVKMTDHRNCKGWKYKKMQDMKMQELKIQDTKIEGMKQIVYLLCIYRVLVLNALLWCSTCFIGFVRRGLMFFFC